MPDASVIARPSLGGYGAGLRAITPLMPAVLAFGVSFGVLSQAAGFDRGRDRHGLAAAGIAVLLKAPLLAVIVVAAVTAALLRAIA